MHPPKFRAINYVQKKKDKEKSKDNAVSWKHFLKEI